MLCWPSFPAVCAPQVKFVIVGAGEIVMVLPAPRVLEVAVTVPLLDVAVTPTLPFALIAVAKFAASVVGLNEIGKCVESLVPAAPPVVVPPAQVKPLIPLASVMPVPEGFVARTVTVAALEVALVVVVPLLVLMA